MRSQEQERAKFAWEKIEEVQDPNVQGKYRSYVREAPSLIMKNGLGNALAFYREKRNESDRESDRKAYKYLLTHLREWFTRHHSNTTEQAPILQWIMDEASSLAVLRETEELVTVLTWLKRFATAKFEGTK